MTASNDTRTTARLLSPAEIDATSGGSSRPAGCTPSLLDLLLKLLR
ncbi:MAG: hypothetical protein AB7F78_03025 [Hyphomicrobiaceae bacterium]